MIENNSFSQDDIRSNLLKYISDHSEIKEFYAGSTGNIVVHLLSGSVAFLAYTAEFNRRESSLTSALLASSVLDRARSLGYNVNRKGCPVVDVVVNSPRDVYLTSDEPVIKINRRNAYVVENIDIPKNTPTMIRLVVGELKMQEEKIATSKDFYRIFCEEDDPYSIDNNIVQIFVNDQPLRHVPYIEEMVADDQVTCLTSLQGGLEIIGGSGELGYSFNNSDVVKVVYIVTDGLLENNLEFSDAYLIPSELAGFNIVTRGSYEDSVEKVRALAPRYYQTLRRAVTIKDYEAIAESYQGVIDSCIDGPRVGNECKVKISYLKDTYQLMSPSEKELFKNYLTQFSILGYDIEITDPVPVYVDLILEVEYVGSDREGMLSELGSKLKFFEYQFEYHLHVVDIERIAYTVKGIRRSYLRRPYSDRKCSKNEYYVLRSANIIVNNNDKAIRDILVDTDETGYSI